MTDHTRFEFVSLHANNVDDDTAYFQAMIDGRLVSRSDGSPLDGKPGDYLAKPRKAVVGGPGVSADVKSKIKNCSIVVRHDESNDYLFYADLSGMVTVKLDGYLICPLDMFTPRQKKAAMEKYHARYKSNIALMEKERLEKIRAALDRCDQCDNGVEPEWPFCPWCGRQLREDENN